MAWFQAKHGVEPAIGPGDMALIGEPVPIDLRKTDVGFTIYPDAFYKVLNDLRTKYGGVPIYITENGACYN